MTSATSITVWVPLKIRRRPGRKTVVTPASPTGGNTVMTRADPALVKALARAFRYQKLLDEGRYASISEMAAAERIERGYLGTLLRLTLLAPEIITAIVDGQKTDAMTFAHLNGAMPVEWNEQCAAFSVGEPSSKSRHVRIGAEMGLAPARSL